MNTAPYQLVSIGELIHLANEWALARMEDEMHYTTYEHKLTDKRAPKTGEWIIFSITKVGGRCSMSELPGCHATKAKAQKEAERLASVFPDKKFAVAKVEGIVQVQGTTWE